jgi:integrase
MFYSLSIFTGALRGEIAALQWQDIDFKERKLRITKTLQHTTESGTYSKSPKTASGVRYIPLDEYILRLLDNYKQYESSIKLFSGKKLKEALINARLK